MSTQDKALVTIRQELERHADELEVAGDRETFKRGQDLRAAWREHIEELARLRRALWELMQAAQYPKPATYCIGILEHAGFVKDSECEDCGGTTECAGMHNSFWTAAAHAFAAEMQKETKP